MYKRGISTFLFALIQLKKYHVIPLAIFESIFTVQVVVIAIISLRIARQIVPLATLILLTLGLTFYASKKTDFRNTFF